MILRTRNPKLVDAIINHPSVRPTAQEGEERLSSDDVLAENENIIYTDGGGAVAFIYKGDGEYEGHIFCVETSRGRAALALGRAALGALFRLPQTSRVVCAVPLQLRAARWLVRRLGFEHVMIDPVNEFEHFKMEAIDGRHR